MWAGNPAGPGISPAGQQRPNSSFRGLLPMDCFSGGVRLRGSQSPSQNPLLHWQRFCTLPQVDRRLLSASPSASQAPGKGAWR
ncbi:hypothetical protein Nmel_007856 [Mimus melanotis]